MLVLTNKRTSGHPVDNPGQLPSLSVVPVVIEQLGEGGEVAQGEDGAEDLEAGLAAESLAVCRTHDGGLQGQHALRDQQ